MIGAGFLNRLALHTITLSRLIGDFNPLLRIAIRFPEVEKLGRALMDSARGEAGLIG